jgi:putative membrane protein
MKLGLGFTVAGFWPAFWGGLVVSVASTVLFGLTGRSKVNVRVAQGRIEQ